MGGCGGGAAGKRGWKKDGEWGSWRDGREVHGGRDEGEGEGEGGFSKLNVY